MNYGKALRIGRAARGLTRSGLAARAHVDASYISLIESGKRSPSREALDAILAGLGLSRDLFDLLAAEPADVCRLPAARVQALGAALLDLFVRGDASSSG